MFMAPQYFGEGGREEYSCITNTLFGFHHNSAKEKWQKQQEWSNRQIR